MSAMRGLSGGVLGLSLLELALNPKYAPYAPKRIQKAAGALAGVVNRLMNPAVPLIPDRRAAVAARYSN